MESDEKSNSNEENKTVALANTGSGKARVETEAVCLLAKTDMKETSDTNTGVTTKTNTAGEVVGPAAKRTKERTKRRVLEPIAEEDGEGLQDGGDFAAEDQAGVETPVSRPTRKKLATGGMKNMLLLTLVCVLVQRVQANEMREKFNATEGAVFHP